MTLRLFLLACATAAGLAGGVGDPPAPNPAGRAVAGPAAVLPPEPVPEDPFPLRRLRATEAQLPAVRDQLDPGPLVRLSRADFEASVRAAGRAVAGVRNAPRLVEARYRASLQGNDLAGTGEFEIVGGNQAAHFLPLDPLRLALGPATWDDGREAVVGVPPGGTSAGVWVDRPGRQTVRFGWSLAGVAEPGERRFELRAPPAAAAVLVLELPAGQVPAVPTVDALLTGPFPIAGGARAEWRVRFGGRSRLDLAVRPAGNPGTTAAATLSARYDLSPGQLACGFEYDLRPAKGTVGEWSFTLAPELRVTDVVVNNRAGWAVDSPGGANAPRRLRVALRQPGAGGKILVTAVAPLPTTGPTTLLPAVRPVGAVLDEERLEIHLAPGTRVGNWNPGDYRLVDAQTFPDQERVLGLVGTLLPPGADRPFRRPPSVQLLPNEAEFSTTEQTAWRLGDDHASATVRVGLRVRRGPVFRFSLRVPDGYEYAGLTATPEDLVSAAGVSGGSVVVDLARPLGAGQATELVFEFRGRPLPPGTHRLPFPAFTPVGAAERVGVLAAYPGPAWVADLHPGAGAARVGWFDPFGHLPPPGAAAAFRYRASAPEGWADLTPARVRFTAGAATAVAASPPGRTATTTFSLRVRSGALPAVLANDAPGATNRLWRVADGGNAVASAAAVPLAALARPCGPAARAFPPRAWVVRLARPATGGLTLETSASIPAEGDPDRFARVAVLGAEPSDPPEPAAQPSRPAPSSRGWAFSGVYLVTWVPSRVEAVVAFGGAVTSAGDRVLPVRLPAGAEVRAASVGGRWVDPGALRVSPDGMLDLPVPSETPVRFEVRYRLAADPGAVASRVRSPGPDLPSGGHAVRRWWVFDPAVLPGWPVRAWDQGTPTDLPPLADEAPFTGVVSRSPADEVWVAGSRVADATGIGVAALLLVLAWGAGRGKHPFPGLLVAAGLLTVGVAALLGPPWWQRAAAVPLVAGLVAAGGMVVARGHRSRVPAGVVLMGAAGVLTQATTTAQPPTPATVVILPADAGGREMVVAGKATLDRLASAARPTTPGVILTSAEYAVTVDESIARVTAKFTAHAIGEVDVAATLPLSDARLERVTVDGEAAPPTSPRPGLYLVPLPGPGRHQVEVRFAVPIGGTGPEREVRFGVPDGPTTKVTADLPAGAKQAQVVGRVGRQTATGGGRVRLEADAGDVEGVLVRWRDGTGGAAAVKVREGCVWDVTEAGARLTACYLVTVGQGTVSSLRFDIPAELDPLDVAVVRRYEDAGKTGPPAIPRPTEPAATAVRARDWTVGGPQGGFRPLRIDLQGPTAGQILVTLTLAQRSAETRQPVLRFPKVAGVAKGPPGEPDAAYGLRSRGVVVEGLMPSGTIDYAPDALTRDRDFAKALRLDPTSQVRVFRPGATGAAELRPSLRPAVEAPAVTLDTSWHLGPDRADVTGTVRWSGKDPQALLEFTLPGVKVTEVRGADVTGWAQSGGRVQVWMAKATLEGEVAWDGTVAKPPSPFDAASPRVADARLTGATIHVRPVEGYDTSVVRSAGWTGSDGSLTFRTAAANATPVRVVVSPLPPVLHPGELGWLGPSPPAPVAPGRPSPAPPPAVRATATAPAEPPPDNPVPWVWPVSAAVGWCAAVGLLALLLARFSPATWPEQFGLVGGLFGVAVAGGWWVGLAAWAAARVTWFVTAPAAPRVG